MSKVYQPAALIKKKRAGEALSQEELGFLVSGFVSGDVADYQMSALLMAIFFRGMTPSERSDLTQLMLHSGAVVDLSHISRFKVDKHSTGGVGDKTSLILAPIVAACGYAVPMISGRGLGHTGGTLDKLESIPGFSTQLSLREFARQVDQLGVCFIGQTPEICPADRKMYALRDVTATVESIPLICASIMSKKLAEGIDGLVLDVKYGSGAFMKSIEQARELAQVLVETGISAGKRCTALLTTMEQPLGTHVGNALEVAECVSILRGEVGPTDPRFETQLLSVELAAEMMCLAPGGPSLESARSQAQKAISSGSAFAVFQKVVHAQGGDLNRLPRAAQQLVVESPRDGYLSACDAEGLGRVGLLLGAGRMKSSDIVDPVAGMVLQKKLGDFVRAGEPLLILHASSTRWIDQAREEVLQHMTVSAQKPSLNPLIGERIAGT